jgi:hypothetical protein
MGLLQSGLVAAKQTGTGWMGLLNGGHVGTRSRWWRGRKDGAAGGRGGRSRKDGAAGGCVGGGWREDVAGGRKDGADGWGG